MENKSKQKRINSIRESRNRNQEATDANADDGDRVKPEGSSGRKSYFDFLKSKRKDGSSGEVKGSEGVSNVANKQSNGQVLFSNINK